MGTSLYRHGRCTAGSAGVQIWSAVSGGAGRGRRDLRRHQCRRRVRLAPAVACRRLGAHCGDPLCAVRYTPPDELLRRGAHPKSALHWPLLIVACVAIPPSILAALDLVVGFWQLRQPTDDDTWSIDHWPMQGSPGASLPAVAVLASFRASGWRTSLWSAAISAAWWGAVSLSYPQHAGSLGDLGGWSAIVWSIALLLAGAVPVAARPSGVGLISPQE